MSSPIKISEAASLALHTMCYLGANQSILCSNKDMAATLEVSEAHLAKVMQRLAKAGLVFSQRGPGGGFRLAKAPEEITLLQVYEATEGPFEEKHCLLGRPLCTGHCILGDLLVRLDREVRNYFTNTRLSDLTDVFIPEACHA